MGGEGVYFILAPYKPRGICYQNIVAGFLKIFVTFVEDVIDEKSTPLYRRCVWKTYTDEGLERSFIRHTQHSVSFPFHETLDMKNDVSIHTVSIQSSLSMNINPHTKRLISKK